MAIITNYYYSDSDENPIPICKSACYLCGNLYNHPFYENGFFVRTSKILSVRDNVVTTYRGFKYHLGEVNPDYSEFLNATKDSIPVISSAELHGNHNSGYVLTSVIISDFIVHSTSQITMPLKILSQDGNYITVDSNRDCNFSSKKYYVNWLNIDFYNDDIQELEFVEFMDAKCRPNLIIN